MPTEPSVVVGELTLRLRPVCEDDLAMFRRFATEPGLVGLDWEGFRDATAPARRFATDGYLGPDDGRLMVDTGDNRGAAGLVSYKSGLYAGLGKYWEIGIALLPEWRGRGIGWRAQALLCDYLFRHTPAQRIQASTHVENTAEQRSLQKAGFTLEGVIRAAQFRAGTWRDGHLYSRLRDDPSPLESSGFTVRRATTDDAQAIGAVFDAAVQAGWTYLGALAEAAMFTPQDWDQLVIDHAPPNVLLVADDQAGQVVGYAAAHPADGELFLLFVHPEYGGRGIGRTLLRAAHDALRTEGCRRAYLFTHVQNERALAVYQNAGYHADGSIRESDFNGTPIRELRLVTQL